MTCAPRTFITHTGLVLWGGLILAGCARGRAQEESEGPVPLAVEHEEAGGAAKVDHPEQFPLAVAEQYQSRPALSVTGVVCTKDPVAYVPVTVMVYVPLGVPLLPVTVGLLPPQAS